MWIENDVPVLAVFGGNRPKPEESAAARLLGVAVNGARAVLLTGGDGGNPRTVKDAAIDAATEAATDDAPAAWVGVANATRAAAARRYGPRALVVTPGWDDRRNFVEACLCDAAVAVGGGPGTASEVLFSLYLGRPVVVVASGPPVPDAARLQALAETRIDWPDAAQLAVDVGIAGAYEWATHGKGSGATALARPLPNNQEAADALVTELIGRITHVSPRPDFDSLVGEPAWDGCVRTALGDAGR